MISTDNFRQDDEDEDEPDLLDTNYPHTQVRKPPDEAITEADCYYTKLANIARG